jgi:DNA polymerase bacteriophage-type
MIKVLKIDFETRGLFEIGGQKGVGLYNYMTHPLTRNLMMGYKLPEETITQLWQPHLGPMPKDVHSALLNPSVLIEAFNSAFERYDLQYLLGITIPPERFIDPQVGGRYLTLPADLESVCEILDLPPHLTKDKRGDALIDLFCKPKYPKKKKGEPQGEPYFNDWNSHPVEWAAFEDYCKRDVDSEEEVMRRLEILEAMPMPEFERRLWIFDQTVNDRGVPTDLEFAQKAYKIALRAKADSLESQNKLTGLANANSRDQLLPWVRERGYPYNTLNKSFVESVLADSEIVLTDECRTVLKARLTAGSNSYTKLAAIMRHICPDGRLRNQFIYLGSSRCGRWSGSSVQLQNLPRPSPPKNVNGYDFEEMDVIVEARQLIYAEDYQGIKDKYGNVLEVIKSLLRTALALVGDQQ